MAIAALKPRLVGHAGNVRIALWIAMKVLPSSGQEEVQQCRNDRSRSVGGRKGHSYYVISLGRWSSGIANCPRDVHVTGPAGPRPCCLRRDRLQVIIGRGCRAGRARRTRQKDCHLHFNEMSMTCTARRAESVINYGPSALAPSGGLPAIADENATELRSASASCSNCRICALSASEVASAVSLNSRSP